MALKVAINGLAALADSHSENVRQSRFQIVGIKIEMRATGICSVMTVPKADTNKIYSENELVVDG